MSVKYFREGLFRPRRILASINFLGNIMLKRTLHISLLATSALLTACGGGDGDSPAELLQTTRHSSVGDITAETYALTVTDSTASPVQ